MIVQRLCLMLVISMCSLCADALEITQVFHEPVIFDPQKSQTVRIGFTLSEGSDVSVNIYDDKDYLVRQLGKDDLEAGQNILTWDGRDELGEFVPSEAYRYTIIAKSSSAGAEHDLSDYTGNKQYNIENIQWDSDKKQFIYSLRSPSRVFIRVGLGEGGPLLATIVNWAPRIAGTHTEFWDGKDTSGVLDLTIHPDLKINLQAYTLSQNTILIGPPMVTPKFINDYSWGSQKRVVKYSRKRKMIAPQQQNPEMRGDYSALLKLPDDLPKNNNGLPIVEGVIPILLDVPDTKVAVALNQRSEPVFYVDGKYSIESEVGFIPMTWKLDTTTLKEGEHYLTVNLRGYEGNFGIATVKVFVKR